MMMMMMMMMMMDDDDDDDDVAPVVITWSIILVSCIYIDKSLTIPLAHIHIAKSLHFIWRSGTIVVRFSNESQSIHYMRGCQENKPPNSHVTTSVSACSSRFQHSKCHDISPELVGYFRRLLSGQQPKHTGIQRNLEENISSFIIHTEPAGGLAPLGVRASAGTLMTKFASHIYTGPAPQGVLIKQH